MTVKYTFTGEFSLEELMEFKTVPALKDLMMTLGMGLKGKPLKEDYVKNIVQLMTEEPQRVVERMYYYELKACLDVIEGRMTLEYAEQSGLLFELNRFGLIYSTINEKTGEKSFLFSKEMAPLLLPLIPAELERREKDGSLLAEKLAFGCANLYGFTDMYYLQKWFPKISQVLGRELSNKDLTQMFWPILREMHYGIKNKERPLMSPFCAFNGFEIENQVRWEIEPKKFDFDTVIGYGEMPYPIIKSPAADKLKRLIEKHGISEAGTPDEIIRQLWIEKQEDKGGCSIPDIAKYFEFTSFDEIQPVMGGLVDFLNTVPFWRLRGNSSEEIGRKEAEAMRKSGRMPRIAIGPNMRAMGIESFEQLQEMARRGEDIPFPPEAPLRSCSPKVGRNDPCPCGSGKKYKHCCGK